MSKTNISSLRRGKHLSYQRGKRNTNPDTSLIKIEGVEDPKAASFYLGKRIAYVYRGKKEIRGSKIRVIWGKVTRTHGMQRAASHTVDRGGVSLTRRDMMAND